VTASQIDVATIDVPLVCSGSAGAAPLHLIFAEAVIPANVASPVAGPFT
jgi:hypothetical protein